MMNIKNVVNWGWVAVLVIVLDQLTKYVIRENFFIGESLPTFLPIFDISYVRNYSVAAPIRWLVEFIFGASEDIKEELRWSLALITTLVSIGIGAWLLSLKDDQKWLIITLALILGGAIGNLIDRISLGFVVDFLDFHAAGYHFPAFNVADSAITVGAGMLIIETFMQHKKEKARQSHSTTSSAAKSGNAE